MATNVIEGDFFKKPMDEVEQAAAFEAFWQACPKKVGKPLARAKWREIVGHGLRTRTMDKDSGMYVDIDLQATPDELLAGMKRYARSLIRVENDKYVIEKRYVVHPATWLNQGRWEDTYD